MADEAKPAATPIEPPHDSQAALASSTPDENTVLMRMLRLLLADKAGENSGRPDRGLIITVVSTLLAGVIMLVYVLAKWGVPIVLGVQPIIDKVFSARPQDEQAKQATQAEQHAVVNKLDQIGGKLDRIDGDVRDLRSHQVRDEAQLRQLQQDNKPRK